MPGQTEKYTLLNLKHKIKNFGLILNTVVQVFPMAKWLPNYKREYLFGDVIAGLTIGLMVIPQSLAYAKLATLPFEYGLYSSFVGPILYSFMGTTKDCAIGPSSILSLFLAQTIVSYKQEFPDSSSLVLSFIVTLISGAWLILLGLFRLGSIFQFVSSTTIKAFSTGASVVVCVSQLSQIVGIEDVNTHQPVHKEIIQMITNIKLFNYQNLLFGASSVLLLLFLMNLKMFAKKNCKRHNFVLSTIVMARNIILLVIMISISALIYNLKKGNIKYNIIDQIPSGFPNPKVYPFGLDTFKFCLVPSIITALLITLEHMGSAKAFATQNNYVIDENQELIVLGLSNLIGSFFGSHPVTGAFSRSAVNSQSGVKTPLSGLLTGAVVLISIQFLTIIFKFIPHSTLSALIFMSLVIKITGYKTIRTFYKIKLGDCVVFVLTYIVTVFTDIKTGLITSIAVSLMFLLFSLCKPRWQLLAQSTKDINNYVELDGENYCHTKPLLPGIVIFRWQDSITYPNAEYFKKKVLNTVYGLTTGGSCEKKEAKCWSDNTEISTLHYNNKISFNHKIQTEQNLKTNYTEILKNNVLDEDIKTIELNSEEDFPRFKAVILDFGCVSTIDYSGLMVLLQLKQTVNEYTNKKGHIYFTNLHKNVRKVIVSKWEELMNCPKLKSYSENKAQNSSHTTQSSEYLIDDEQDFICNSINDAIERIFYTYYA